MTDPAGLSDVNIKKAVPFFLYIALFALLTCINALGAKFAVFSFTIAPGVSAFYIVIAVMVVFALWFGVYGAVAAYTGCLIGAGLLSGLPLPTSLYWSLADFWQAAIPLVAFRVFGCDPALRSRKDLFVLFVFGIVLNNLAGAVWGSAALAVSGSIPWSGILPVMANWFASNVVVCLLLVPVLLYFLTPVIRNHELYVRHYWG